MFNWILTSNIADAESVYEHLTDMMIPFDDDIDGKMAKRVHELVKDRIRKADELVDCLFQPLPDRQALAEWNLLVKSGMLEYSADTEMHDNTNNLSSKDYGKYLERLFDHVTSTSSKDNSVLVKESSDPIEMYLEYYKYGQIRSMTLLQEDLLSNYEIVELLLRIPVPVLRWTGAGFGGIILDHFLVKGLTEKDILIIGENRDIAPFSVLKMYYKDRINVV